MNLDLGAELALGNLTSPPVLAFIFGVLVVSVLRSDLRLPGKVAQFLSVYLLLAIGIKGGVALRDAHIGDVIAPALAAVVLGCLIPVAAFGALRWLTRLSPLDRGALSAHYGSTSLVTFTAALAILEVVKIPFEGYVATLLTIMEIPGIIVGLLLATRAAERMPSRVLVGAGGPAVDEVEAAPQRTEWSRTLREVVTGPSVLLLVGGLFIGVVTGPSGYASVEPLFSDLFKGVLTLYLLHLGCVAGERLRDVRAAGPGLIVFALVFPVVAGTAGVIAGTLAGMSIGGAAVLGVLCASASYIAAPAAVSLALPKANTGLCLTASLGITFPFNLIIGIPLLVAIAQAIA